MAIHSPETHFGASGNTGHGGQYGGLYRDLDDDPFDDGGNGLFDGK